MIRGQGGWAGLLPVPVLRPVVVSVEPVGRVPRNLARPLFLWIPSCPLLLFKKLNDLRAGHEDPEGQCRYSCTLSLTLVLGWGGRSKLHPSAGKETRVPVLQEDG